MSLVSQPVLPLTLPGAVEIGPIAALVVMTMGGRWSMSTGWPLFVSMPAMRWGAGWRRCSWRDRDRAAVAGCVRVRVTRDTLWRWRQDSPRRGWRGWCRANAARPGRSS